MVQRKSDEINILREKATAKLTKELEELHNLSAEELKMRYLENPMSDSGSNEDKLKKEVEGLRTIFDASPISIWNKDTKNNFIRVNKAAAKFVGREIAEIEGRSADEIFPLESEKYYKDDLEVISTGKSKIGIIETVTAKGETRWVRTDKIPWYSPTGEIAGIIAFARDITTQKIAEQNFKESEELFRRVITNAPISIFATDEKGFFTLHEGKAIERVGMKSGENVGISAYDLFSDIKVIEHNGTVSTGKAVLDRVSKGEYLSGITELNGVIFDNQFAPIWDENNKVAGLLGVATDITERKLAEEKLRHSEHNLAEAERIGNTGSWDYDMATDTSGWSENMYRIFDVDPDETKELLFKHFVEKLVHPEDRSLILSVFQDALVGKRPYDLEYRIIKRDGSIRTIHALAETVFDGNGKAIKMLGKVEDITERKRAEETIKRNLVEITSYYDNAPIGLAVLDINLRFLRINNLLAEINGIPAAEHIGKTLKELVPALAEQAKEVVSRIIKLDKPVIGIEFNGETAAQPGVKHVWLESWYPIRNDFGKIAGYMVIVQDITERKLAEEKLKHSEHNLAEAERIGNTGSWDYDVATDTASWSENMFRIFDVDPDKTKELLFKHFVENLVHPDDRSYILSVFKDALAGKCPYDLEYRIIKLDGSIRTIHTLAETVFDENGKAIRMIGKAEDITERKQMEKKLTEHEHELQKLSTELINAQEKERKILSQELHDEVGQSLTAMKINLASIMKILPVEHDAKTKNRLKEMNDILENLISQVHEISLNLRPAMLDVLGLLPTIKSYGNQFSERTGIMVHIANGDGIVNLDKEQEIHIFRIMQEALTNVVKHAHAKNIFLNLIRNGNILILSIQDDGCGFILNEKESIHPVGIGLIGMRERVNSLKGLLEINTSPEKGTKIEIQIPINRKHE